MRSDEYTASLFRNNCQGKIAVFVIRNNNGKLLKIRTKLLKNTYEEVGFK